MRVARVERARWTATRTTRTTRTRGCGGCGDGRRARARETRARAGGSNDEDAPSGNLSEASLADVVAKLRAAEAERERLRVELERQAGAKATVKSADELVKSRARIDGVGKREQIFGKTTAGDAWLRDGMEFLVRDQPSEAGVAVEGMTKEDEATVSRRLAIGLALAGGFAALSQISIEAPEPTKPLFFYLVPIVRSRELLRRAQTLATEGEWDELNSTVNRVTGPPNEIRENLFKAAAYLSGSEEEKARAIAFDFLEYMEKVNYAKYFENMGIVSGSKAAEYASFSAKASKSAIDKLNEFLALMDREAVEAAESQVMALTTAFTSEDTAREDAPVTTEDAPVSTEDASVVGEAPGAPEEEISPEISM